MINTGIVANVIGVILIVLGVFMLTSLGFSFYFNSPDSLAITGAAFTSIVCGAIVWYITRNSSKQIGKREGYLIVALSWVTISFFSSLPYTFSQAVPGFTDAIFEAVSGLTTTGATILNDIESVPKGILFWRSLTQWLGGMGIIVLTVAIFPLLGIGGVELFVAEAPGPTSDKIHPRIKESAKRLWMIYVGLTFLLMTLLLMNGMTFYDAINHALTTMATGGFSTKNASMAHYNTPGIQYTIAFFMFLAGTNYTIIYFSLNRKFKRVWKSDEFKAYLILVSLLTILVTVVVYKVSGQGFEKSFRDAVFQIISIITTTGYVSADYTSWSPSLTLLFFLLLFMGACAGSTSGGIKVIRHLVFFKNIFLEFKRLLHPRAVIRIKVDQQIVRGKILTHILVFLLLYLAIFVISSLIMTIIFSDFEQPLITALGAVATSLGNVGPAIGGLGPLDNFAEVPGVGKWFLVWLMLIGRLEIFTILILFTPYFWRD